LKSVLKMILGAAFLLALAPDPSATAEDHRERFRRLPPSPELLYLPERYSACLPCHPRPVFEEEDFNTDTNFRDTRLGKNLHWMHVLRQPQGTNCSACHRLDPETARLSYPAEVGFVAAEKGGSCAPACHRRKQYRNAGRSR